MLTAPDAGGPLVRQLDAELVLDARAELGEGPGWDAAAGILVWVDILAGQVCLFDPAQDPTTAGGGQAVKVGEHVGAAVTRARGGLVLAVRDGFSALDTAADEISMLAVVDPRPDTRMNDGKCDPDGRFWAGTMRYDEQEGGGALYRLDPDGTVTTVLTGVTTSNGLGWSPDGHTMYYIDTPTRRMDAFEFDPATGALGARRTLTEVEGTGFPDGMTVDHEGMLWVALWGGSAVHRYTPQGDLDTVVNLPVTRVTSCAFGGPDGADLYITTARTGLSESALAAQPAAGGLFRCRPGVTGPPATAFAG
jgi:sugar lactone lactonase YvrE